MNFWTPTKKKSATTLLLILLWLVFSAVSSLAHKTYDKYSFELLASSNYRKELKKPTKQYIQATQSARRDISNETVGKLEMAGYLKISTQIAAGILIAYLGSCIICRRETQECV